MKRIFLYGLMVVVIFAAFNSCTKNDGPTAIPVDYVPAMKVNKTTGTPSIDMLNLSKFAATFTVDHLSPGSIKPEKVDVVIRKNGDNSNVKVYKADLATFPSNFDIKVADFESLFGTAVKLNDSYDVSTDIYYNGQKYAAYPNIVVGQTTSGANIYAAGWGAGVSVQASVINGTPNVTYSAICAYDPSIYQGDFEVISDEFGDLAPGAIVPLVKVDDKSFTFTFATAKEPLPIKVTVNVADNSVNVAKQLAGTQYWEWEPTYTIPTAQATGVVYPCDQRVVLDITWGVFGLTGPVFGGGPYTLELKKK